MIISLLQLWLISGAFFATIYCALIRLFDHKIGTSTKITLVDLFHLVVCILIGPISGVIFCVMWLKYICDVCLEWWCAHKYKTVFTIKTNSNHE